MEEKKNNNLKLFLWRTGFLFLYQIFTLFESNKTFKICPFIHPVMLEKAVTNYCRQKWMTADKQEKLLLILLWTFNSLNIPFTFFLFCDAADVLMQFIFYIIFHILYSFWSKKSCGRTSNPINQGLFFSILKRSWLNTHLPVCADFERHKTHTFLRCWLWEAFVCAAKRLIIPTLLKGSELRLPHFSVAGDNLFISWHFYAYFKCIFFWCFFKSSNTA